MANAKNKATHVTKSSGNVFADLGLADSILLQMKTDLHSEIVRVVKSKKIAPRELEKMFDVPQPRISELLRGKLAGLSINKLTEYAASLGIRPKLAFERARAA